MISSPVLARRLVLVSLLAVLAMAAYRGKLSSASDTFAHRLWGVGLLGTFLTVLADIAPQLAGPFAVLVALGYATTGGDKAITNILGKVSGSGGPGVQVTPTNVPQVQPTTSPGANP